MTPTKDEILSDIESEENIHDDNFYDDFEELCPNSHPESIDYQTWKKDVGGLIQSETHVLLHDEEQLRSAITQAMFLETASENLLNKRKRQIELLDGLREQEGGMAKKLFDDVKTVLRKDFGPCFESIEERLETAIAKSQLPLNAPPDTTQPPPTVTQTVPTVPIQLPPMNIPPPSTPSSLVLSTPPPPPPPSSSNSNLRELMAEHLLPPPVTPQTEWSDKKEKEHDRSMEHKHEQHREHDSPRGAFRFPIGEQDTSWRTPFLPTPLPPPKPFHSSPFVSPFLRPPPGVSPLERNSQTGPLAAMAPPSIRRVFERYRLPPLPPPPYRSPSPPGLVGVNVRGLFVGNRHPTPKGRSFRRYNFRR